MKLRTDKIENGETQSIDNDAIDDQSRKSEASECRGVATAHASYEICTYVREEYVDESGSMCVSPYEAAQSIGELISRAVMIVIGQSTNECTNLHQSDRSEEECKNVPLTSVLSHVHHVHVQLTLDMCTICLCIDVILSLFVLQLLLLRLCLSPTISRHKTCMVAELRL